MATDVETKPDVILYPDGDGQRISDNTLQFQWIMTLQGNLDLLFRSDPNVFVAGDLLWYAQEGNPAERTAPDAMVVFGRQKGYRGSYMQWREGGIAPQVVFEVLSPGNRAEEMNHKFDFYERHGVEEYYVYDPDDVQLTAWVRTEGRLRPVYPIRNFTSPRLQVRFDLSGEELVVIAPDGSRFLTFLELGEQKLVAQREAAESRLDAEAARKRAEQLAARLRELGVDPDSLTPPAP
jgi:Uma2 family endonuclease